MTLFGALGWSGLYFVLAPAVMGITEAFSPAAEKDIVNHAACRVLAASVAIFAIARVHAPEAPLRSTLGLRGSVRCKRCSRSWRVRASFPFSRP